MPKNQFNYFRDAQPFEEPEAQETISFDQIKNVPSEICKYCMYYCPKVYGGQMGQGLMYGGAMLPAQMSEEHSQQHGYRQFYGHSPYYGGYHHFYPSFYPPFYPPYYQRPYVSIFPFVFPFF